MEKTDVRIDCKLCIGHGVPDCLRWEVVEIGICSGPVSHLRSNIRKGRKEYECQMCCDEPIKKGDLHRCDVMSIQGEVYTFRTCLSCMRAEIPRCRRIIKEDGNVA